MRFLLALLGFVGHSAVEQKKENVCKHRKQRSRQAASQYSTGPTQTPCLPMVQDIRAQGRDAVTTESQVATVMKAKSVKDSKCQSISSNKQASVFDMHYGKAKAKSTALTVRRKTRKAGTKRLSCATTTAKDCHDVTTEGQSAVSFEIVTPESQIRKSQRRVVVSNSSPHHTGKVSEVLGVFQRGRKTPIKL